MNWFNIIKGKGSGKTPFKKWLRIFVREHLEGMEVGETISSREMVEVAEEKKSEGTYLSPKSGRRPEMQVKFSTGRVAPKIRVQLIANIIKLHKDIVKRVPEQGGRAFRWERI